MHGHNLANNLNSCKFLFKLRLHLKNLEFGFLFKIILGVPGWFSELSPCLRLKS